MFRTLLNKTILSLDHTFLRNLGKKTFSMILLGIEALNVKSDISLQILIRDLFDQYISLLITPINNTNNFKISDSLLKCFKDAKADFVRLIFEILMTNFLSITSDNMMHKHSYLVCNIFIFHIFTIRPMTIKYFLNVGNDISTKSTQR